MLSLVSYQITLVDEDGTETPVSYVEYDTELLSITEHMVQINQNGTEIKASLSPHFLIEDNVEKFGFLYCVSYRHPSLPEWILARGFWNDDGIWTNDDIWNDF